MEEEFNPSRGIYGRASVLESFRAQVAREQTNKPPGGGRTIFLCAVPLIQPARWAL